MASQMQKRVFRYPEPYARGKESWVVCKGGYFFSFETMIRVKGNFHFSSKTEAEKAITSQD